MSRIYRVAMSAALALIIAVAMMPAFVHAAPSVIPYQGRLTDAAGTPLNGSFVLKYSIYAVPTGGSAAWSDTQTVSVANGLFSSTLGVGVPFGPNLFNATNLYLGIAVGTDAEMVPRQQLLPVPFAIRAEEVPLALKDHDFTVTFFNGSGTWWAVVKGDGTILRQSGGFTSSKSSTGVYSVDNPGLDESQAGVTLSSFNSPGAGTDAVIVTGFANSASGIIVVTYGVGLAGAGSAPGTPDLRYTNLGLSQK